MRTSWEGSGGHCDWVEVAWSKLMAHFCWEDRKVCSESYSAPQHGPILANLRQLTRIWCTTQRVFDHLIETWVRNWPVCCWDRHAAWIFQVSYLGYVVGRFNMLRMPIYNRQGTVFIIYSPEFMQHLALRLRVEGINGSVAATWVYRISSFFGVPGELHVYGELSSGCTLWVLCVEGNDAKLQFCSLRCASCHNLQYSRSRLLCFN